MKLIFSKALTQLTDLDLLAGEINQKLQPGSIILLSGDLGAGKTSFVSAFCRLHDISTVQSPTYAIHNRYENSSAKIIDHFDLYRLETEDEINASGFYDLLSEPTEYKFIEWSERLSSLNFDAPTFRLKLSLNENKRQADFYKIEND